MADAPKAAAPPQTDEPHRCGVIAIIGAPNAGKSTLVNALVGAKVTIISRKVQTTRIQIRGIAMEGASQLVLIDTPGIFAPKRRLDKAMVASAWAGAADADQVLVLVDAAKGIDEDVEQLVSRLAAETRKKAILVLNKIDRVEDKGKLLALVQDLSGRLPFERVFMIAALNGDGVAELKRYLAQQVPEGPWLYPEDELSDIPVRQLAAEVTREKIYNYLHDELPYQITVETESWKTLRDKSVRVEQVIYVERDSQKSIVLGKGGQTIKKISQASRTELTEIVGEPVHLFLFVKVREGWDRDPERYREMGLEFPKED
ncbi:MAG: GTPase Era [Hyphomicrobium zavarzinii]|uniref:GTPase Era n=1 Tax=Hyphomicrobium TaxID=81 RepID=UPI000380A5E2|nr:MULTISPECIES: GTPase Era [Hyphomicrobium]MBL8847226.1 GTPase Era [Hyphomicrobium zavarzinii]WBT37451.1 GTPase Era [Hyphomicrobium sp. DMF-1]HML42291.1 GTPase Era [Hyphomicrobium zavarzinii]